MKKNGLLLSALLLVAGTTFGQDYQFKKMNFAPIKGAPSLTQPTFLTDVSGNPITVGKRGHALPTLYDWNKDGLTDLLVGEFGNGKDAYLMIYENVGTATAPRFSDKPYYAKDKEGNLMFMEVS